jgi:hypothetical protein
MNIEGGQPPHKSESPINLSEEEKQYIKESNEANDRIFKPLQRLLSPEALQNGTITKEEQQALKEQASREWMQFRDKFPTVDIGRINDYEIQQEAMSLEGQNAEAPVSSQNEESTPAEATYEVIDTTPSDEDGARLDNVKERLGMKNPELSGEGNFRQQNKIIQLIESGNPEVLSQNLAGVSASERSSFLEKLTNGTLSDDELDKKVIAEIARPLSQSQGGIENFTNELYRSGKMPEILGAMQDALYGSNRRRQDSTFFQSPEYMQDEISRFLQKFPTPRSFEASQAGRTYTNDSLGRASQREDGSLLENFKMLMYGKKYEYWKQIKILKQEAGAI